jgi:Protein of unknown function (DUF3097)
MPGHQAASVDFPQVEAIPGLVVVHRGTRFRGAVVRVERDAAVVLRSLNHGAERLFTMRPGAFAVGGETSTLIRPRPQAPSSPGRTASGSVSVRPGRALVAKAGRILVEGVHDAELVEKVWGDDLRAEGIVVERLDGVDVLPEFTRAFRPGPSGRLGVLVDHLVDGSKESRLATSIRHSHVRVRGTPYVDVWQAVRPSVLGIQAWPVVPRGQSWKQGICDTFGEPAPARFWKRLLGSVHTYADLEPSLVGAVESLIDFVTTGE